MMNFAKKLDTVFYPFVGMNHITKDLAHLIEYKMEGKKVSICIFVLN